MLVWSLMMGEGDIFPANPSVESLSEELRNAARSGRLVHYGEIGVLLNINISSPQGRRQLAKLLREVCAAETRQGRPMLGSLVVRKDTGMPGAGFFRGALTLGVFCGETADDRQLFWTAEVRRVFHYWKGR